MLKLQNLEGHFQPLLPGLLASTWQQSQCLCTRQRKPAFLLIIQLQLSKKASVRVIPVRRFRGRTAARWPIPFSLAHEDTEEGRGKAGLPLWQTRQKWKRKVNKGSEIREEPAGQTQSDVPSSPLSRRGQHAFLQTTRALGPWKPRDPAAPAAPAWDTEKSENRGESGMAILFMQSNGADN